MADWADTLEQENLVKLSTFRGKAGITTLLSRPAADNSGLVSIICDAKSAYMQFLRTVFERRAPGAVPAVEAIRGTELRQGNSTHTFPESLLAALTEAYREAVGKPATLIGRR